MQPEIIITQAQCEVCAVSLKTWKTLFASGLNPALKSYHWNRINFQTFGRILLILQEALGVKEQGHELVSQLKQRMNKIAQKTINFSQKPTVVCIEWIEPLMSAGNWMPELIEIGGGN